MYQLVLGQQWWEGLWTLCPNTFYDLPIGYTKNIITWFSFASVFLWGQASLHVFIGRLNAISYKKYFLMLFACFVLFFNSFSFLLFFFGTFFLKADFYEFFAYHVLSPPLSYGKKISLVVVICFAYMGLVLPQKFKNYLYSQIHPSFPW